VEKIQRFDNEHLNQPLDVPQASEIEMPLPLLQQTQIRRQTIELVAAEHHPPLLTPLAE
jgi:hypothetical protein